MKHTSEIVILGAGPAGMAAAIELHKSKNKFILVEKDKKVGGLAKTYKFGEFLTDNGPHRFFSKNKFLYDFIENLLGEDWIKVKRSTRQFIDGKFYDYPINALQAFKNIGLRRASRMGVDYLKAIIEYRILGKKIKNFEDYIIANFGKSLGNLNMLNYSEKLWGMKCSNLDSEWANQRIKGLNFKEALINSVYTTFSSRSLNTPKTLVDEFYYPSKGSGLIYEQIAKVIRKQNDILLNTYPTLIKHTNKKITTVILSNGNKIKIKNLITSIPIDTFVKLLNPSAPVNVLNSLSKLKYRSQVYIFLTINKKKITKDQWIYFPDEGIPLFRMSEMKNFSKEMSPKNKTSLFIEYFCWEGDELWNKSKKDLFELTIFWLEKLNFIKRSDVINYYHIRKEKTYPVYDLNYKKNLRIVNRYLDSFDNLVYIGRPGRFKYTNQDHSLEMGFLAARSIIENRKINVEDVGSEKEYFEKGYLK